MEKRFVKRGVFENATGQGCPVLAEEITLWQDTEHDVLFLVPKLKNEYDGGAVTVLTVGYSAEGKSGTEDEHESGYRIEISQGAETGMVFGQDQVITLSLTDCVDGCFFIEKAEFSDGHVWEEEKDESSEKEEDTPNVTMVKTIGGFGPEGPLFRKVPLSMIVAQRMSTQFITTIIAVIGCIWNLVKYILLLRMSDTALIEKLAESVLSYGLFGAETTDEAISAVTDMVSIDQVRLGYVLTAVLFAVTILFLVYTVFYFSENRRKLRKSVVTDTALAQVVKKIKIISIVELVLCGICNFNFFGVFAGISGLSVTSLHKRIMKSKENKEIPQI